MRAKTGKLLLRVSRGQRRRTFDERVYVMTEGFEAVIPLTQVSMSPSHGSVIRLNDGRLLWVWAHKGVHAITSDDGGRTWGEPRDVVLTTGEPMSGVMAVNLLQAGPRGTTRHGAGIGDRAAGVRR